MRQYNAKNRDHLLPLKAGYQRKLHAERRALIDAAKTQPCMDCGQSFPPSVMEFDHVRGQKVSDVTKMVKAPIAKMYAEIAKCELVCANCHRLRTLARRLRNSPTLV